MNFNYNYLRNLAIILGLFTFIWMVFDSFRSYNPLASIYKKANKEFLKKNYKEALELYTQAYTSDKANIFALEGQARSLMRLKLYDQAEIKFKEVIKQDREFVAGYANLGILYDTVGKYNKAIEFYDIVIMKDKKIISGMKWFNRLMKNIQFKPSNIKERRDYLNQQYALPQEDRNFRNTTLDEIQPDFQM